MTTNSRPAKSAAKKAPEANKAAPANESKAPEAEAPAAEAAPKPEMRYFLNGRSMSPTQHQFHQLAWYGTKGIAGADSPRIGSKALAELLAKQGITEVQTTEYDATLPNGNTVHARFAKGSKMPAPVEKPKPEKATKATAAAKKAATVDAAKKEAAAARAAKKAGEPKPATPALDELEQSKAS